MLCASARKHCPPRGPCQSRLKAVDHPKCRACPCPSCVRVRVTIVRGATQLTRRSAVQWERNCRAGNAPGPGGGGLPRHHSANAGRIAMAKLRTRMHGKCRKCHHQKRGVHGPCYTPDAISSNGSPFTPGHVLYPSALLAVFAVLYWSLRLRLAVYSSGLLIRPMG